MRVRMHVVLMPRLIELYLLMTFLSMVIIMAMMLAPLRLALAALL